MQKVFSFNVSCVRNLENITSDSYINKVPFPNLVVSVRAEHSLLEFRNLLGQGESKIANYKNHYVIITIRKAGGI